jgi:outer membrane protein TolC
MDVDRLRRALSERMTSPPPNRPLHRPLRSPLVLSQRNLLLLACLGLAPAAYAQVSFNSAVSLALSTSPRVRMAQADLDRAHASLSEAHDAYIPSIAGSLDLGKSVGPPLGEPSLFTIKANSLVYNYSQKDYTRAATSGIAAAGATLQQVREEVAEDAAVTYLALDSDLQRQAVLAQQLGFATQLATIVQQRIDAGQDTQFELHQARRTAAQIHLQMLQLDDEIDGYRSHLARVDGLPDGPLATESTSIPALPDLAPQPSGHAAAANSIPDTPAVAAAFATARSKQEQAFGDSRYLYRPQVAMFGEYSRFTTFDNNYRLYYPAFNGLTLNAIAIGIEITVPFYDRVHVAKARESLADAHHAAEEALYARDQMFEGRIKLQHASAELAAQADLAGIDQQIAQDQLDAILTQLQTGNGNPAGPQLTPKDEQKARIQERQHYLDLLDARSKLSQTQIQLLRLTGRLDAWLKSAIAPASH